MLRFVMRVSTATMALGFVTPGCLISADADPAPDIGSSDAVSRQEEDARPSPADWADQDATPEVWGSDAPDP